MSKSKKHNSKNNLLTVNDLYKTKCKTLKKTVKDNVYENAAICDEIAQTQEKLLIVREECKFLLKKLKHFEPQFGVPGNSQVEPTTAKKTPSKKPKYLKKTEKKSEKKTDKKANTTTTTTTTTSTTSTTITSPTTTSSFTNTLTTPTATITTNGATKSTKRPAIKRKKNAGDVVQDPITSGNVTIFNFGQIVYDTPFYYSDCAIYPAGYYATRTYAHFRNIFSKCTYHCKVIKAGSSPRFEIMDHDKHFKVTGLSTDECHSHLVSLINKMLGADDLIPANRNGDRFFGLSIPTVRLKLQKKPESKFCTGYIPIKSQADNAEAELKAEDDPSVSFEGLHACLNRFRSRH